MFTPTQKADEIVRRIIADLTDRKGLRHVWDDFDEDTQDEIARRGENTPSRSWWAHHE